MTSMRASQVRAVGAAFLRMRPWLVAPVALTNVLVLRSSGAEGQRLALGALVGLGFAFFCAEAWYFRVRDVSERWFFASLVLTVLMLMAASILTGGASSPFLVLLLAPTSVGVAAFGRTKTSVHLLVLAGMALLAIAVVPSPFPPLDRAGAQWMVLAALVGTGALVFFGVDGLVDAHVRTAELLDRMRIATLEESSSRMRATEQIGAKVAHEVKNPLAAVRALVQLIEQGAHEEKAKKRCSVALAEIDRIDAVVRDYLAFARPLAELDRRPVDLIDLAHETAAVMEAKAAALGVSLVVAGRSVRLSADPRRLREALMNLVANAVEASPRGATVRIDVVETTNGGEVRIEDEGPGMPAEVREQDSLFFTKKVSGTGLGLALARGAVKQHGGDLVFVPREPRGTVAKISLPKGAP